MASTAGICYNFKHEVLRGEHQLGTVLNYVSRTSLTVPTTDVIKAALYLAAGTTGPGTATYTTTNEASGTGYTAGGIAVTNANPPALSNTSYGAWTPSAPIQYPTITVASIDSVLIYNSTQTNKSIEVCTFTAQTVSAATFTLTMPSGTAPTALINIA